VYERPLPALAAAPGPAHGGRLFARAEILELLEGLLVELPKPLGAWPRSVVLPWAFQERVLFPTADGGRFCESWFCRAVVPALFGELALPEKFPGRPGVRPFVFIVWTGMCEAPAPGEVRAITERFSTDEGGRDTLPLAFAAPKALCLDGETPRLFVTCAPRSEDSLI